MGTLFLHVQKVELREFVIAICVNIHQFCLMLQYELKLVPPAHNVGVSQTERRGV